MKLKLSVLNLAEGQAAQHPDHPGNGKVYAQFKDPESNVSITMDADLGLVTIASKKEKPPLPVIIFREICASARPLLEKADK